MTREEAINQLYFLIADINTTEIASHVQDDSLSSWSNSWRISAKEIIEALKEPEKVHAHWIQKKTTIGKIYSVCSNCEIDFKFKTDKGTLARLDMNGMSYCPNCGATMDKEE